MIEFPSLKPIESTTLGPESALFAAELAERIGLALRAIATGMHVGNVTMDAAVADIEGEIRDAAGHLFLLMEEFAEDGRAQLRNEWTAIGFRLSRDGA